MFEKFCDYMYYLLTSPFKKIRKSLNQWYILFEVLGRRFDDTMESLYNAAEQTMVATCDPEMLPLQAEERGITRYQGETDENFRKRIANYAEVCRLGGSDAGVLLAVRSLGFDSVSIVKARDLGNTERWAEFYVIINVDPDDEIPIGYDILRQQVRKVKYTTALDNYQLVVGIPVSKINTVIARCIVITKSRTDSANNCKVVICCKAVNKSYSALHIDIKNNLWYFDGTYYFDGTKIFNAYETREDI